MGPQHSHRSTQGLKLGYLISNWTEVIWPIWKKYHLSHLISTITWLIQPRVLNHAQLLYYFAMIERSTRKFSSLLFPSFPFFTFFSFFCFHFDRIVGVFNIEGFLGRAAIHVELLIVLCSTRNFTWNSVFAKWIPESTTMKFERETRLRKFAERRKIFRFRFLRSA